MAEDNFNEVNTKNVYNSNNYSNQYKLLFYLTWIILYFIFPTWRFSQINVLYAGEFIQSPIKGQYILLTYFFFAAIYLHFCLKILFVTRPLRVHFNNLFEDIRNNVWFAIVCFISTALHIYSKSLYGVITAHSKPHKTALKVYDIMIYNWNKLSDFPIQVPVWFIVISLILIIMRKQLSGYIADKLSSLSSLYNSNYFMKYFSILLMVVAFLVYAELFPYYSWQDHAIIMNHGYPPLGTLLQLGIYLLFGTGYLFLPSLIVQFTFYILGSFFLYKTINLFCDNKTALLGSSLFLFSPFIFAYATVDKTASGTVFFIIIVSYFFMKFIRDGKNEDIILTAYFISLGVLYKRVIIVLFIACSLYLIFLKIKHKNLHLRNHLMILSVSLISFIPWYFIGTRIGANYNLSHFGTDYLLAYFFMIPTQISWPIFVLLLLSIIFILLVKRNHISVFFGLVSIGYYALLTSLKQEDVQRYSSYFYPAISVFLAQFLYHVSQKIRWRYTFKFISIIVIIYLAILCVIPRSHTKLITFKYKDFENQHFPIDDAVEWILNGTGKNEKVFRLFLGHYILNRVKEIPEDKIIDLNILSIIPDFNNISGSVDLSSFRQFLKEQFKRQKMSYIMFAGGVARTFNNPDKQRKEIVIRKFLEEDKHDDFILAAKFNVDDNYIYIYKVRNSFIEKE